MTTTSDLRALAGAYHAGPDARITWIVATQPSRLLPLLDELEGRNAQFTAALAELHDAYDDDDWHDGAAVGHGDAMNRVVAAIVRARQILAAMTAPGSRGASEEGWSDAACLGRAYIAALQLPPATSRFRASMDGQRLLSSLRDFVARAENRGGEDVQNDYERRAARRPPDVGEVREQLSDERLAELISLYGGTPAEYPGLETYIALRELRRIRSALVPAPTPVGMGRADALEEAVLSYIYALLGCDTVSEAAAVWERNPVERKQAHEAIRALKVPK